MTDEWSDLEDVDGWDEIDVDEDPPRRDPVKPMLLGRGITLLTVDVEEMQ